ncbi:ankyrin repeat [Fusarium mexicanum]|uniref:Ankyrin repeat n=1 Tax=Fusarium mexicanum TaxID=751941 RepID=A0A8H5IW68_9HYPO|nr:ankyrin repeat [Fusarium mexicanum]
MAESDKILFVDKNKAGRLHENIRLYLASVQSLKTNIASSPVIVGIGTQMSQSLLEHRDKDGRTPVSLAAGAGRKDIVELLVGAGADIHSEDDQDLSPLSWIASQSYARDNYDLLLYMMELWENSDKQPTRWRLKHLYQAARFGWTYAVLPFLTYLDSNIDTLLPSEETSLYHEKTALCIAAEYGHGDVVEILLQWDANVNFATTTDGYTPLMLAINGEVNEYLKAAVIDVLLTGGAVISKKNAKGVTAEELAMNKGLQSVLTRLTWRNKDGPAAEKAKQLDQNVNSRFSATVTNFETEGDSLKRFVSEKYDVGSLLQKLEDEAKEPKEVAFKWIHFPANNMRWIEVLISQLYKDKMQTYNILRPERWVRRQHHRGLNTLDKAPEKPGIHHARFMRPLCQAFRSSRNLSIEKDNSDTDLVLFMPYLHWDVTKQQTRREEVMKQPMYRKNPDQDWKNDERFLNAYLFYRKDSQDLPDQERLSPEQHYSTRERDCDQVLSRAACQKKLHPDSKVLTMVDQLWLWVLAGKGGQPTTIVTCFPQREQYSDKEASGSNDTVNDNVDDLDPNGDTDVLKQVLSHILDYPQAYMDMGGQGERLRFKEMYEMAIGDVMHQETELFDEFTTVMKASKKEPDNKRSLIAQFKALSEVENSKNVQPKDTKQAQANLTEQFESVLEELNDNSANRFVNSLVKSSGGKISQEKVQRFLKLAQFRVLDITKEVQLLDEIKDVQDELRIMSMIFRDQKVIIHEMEEIMQSIPFKSTMGDPSVSRKFKAGEPAEIEHSEESETNYGREKTPVQDLDGKADGTRVSSPQERNSVHVGNNAFFSLAKGAISPMPGLTDYHVGNNAFFTSMTPGPSTSLNEKKRYVLSPCATVQLSIDEIQDMIDGANNAYNASNVMDARYARVQAEQSEKQGKTIMVFTIVTIVFLPLSFMAAFFAIDIAQFKRVKDDKLSLGYVSEIMFPISGAIIASLIYIAFKIESLEWMWTHKLPWWKREKVTNVEEGLQQNMEA